MTTSNGIGSLVVQDQSLLAGVQKDLAKQKFTINDASLHHAVTS